MNGTKQVSVMIAAAFEGSFNQVFSTASTRIDGLKKELTKLDQTSRDLQTWKKLGTESAAASKAMEDAQEKLQELAQAQASSSQARQQHIAESKELANTHRTLEKSLDAAKSAFAEARSKLALLNAETVSMDAPRPEATGATYFIVSASW